MIKSVSFLGVDNKYNLKNTKTEAKENTFQRESLSLSNSQVGQAILARNNISFRNLSQPIEITDRYNKPVPGKDHLDLPNIHVYEFPDTNLQVLLNIANKIKNPIITMMLTTEEQTEFNPIMSNLIKIIINEKLINCFDANTYYENEGSVTSYFQTYDPEAIKNFSELNKLIFNTTFNEDELMNAKKELIKYVDSDEYKYRNADLRYLYKPNDFKTQNDLIEEINSITINDIQNYKDDCLKNSEGIVYVVISKDSLLNNKYEFFKSINENIPVKLKTTSNTEDVETFVPNNQLHCINGIPDLYPLNFNYKVSFNNAKETLIGEIAELILMNNNYIVFEKYYNDPIDIKAPKQINTCLYLKINADMASNQNINPNEEYKKFQDYVTEVYESDLSNDLVKYKALLKDDYKYDLQENEDSKERLIPFSINEYFQIYELINSIKEQDIKDFIRKFIIEQKPIIHINDVSKYEDYNYDKTN